MLLFLSSPYIEIPLSSPLPPLIHTYIFTNLLPLASTQAVLAEEIHLYDGRAVGALLLHFVALCCTFLHFVALCCTLLHVVALCCTLLHFVALCCTLLHFVALCCSVPRTTVWCSLVWVSTHVATKDTFDCETELIGCNNGGRGGNFSKVKRCKVDKNTERVILRFFCCTGVILETQELYPKAYFTHKPPYSYLSLFMSSWNMQEHWDSDLFCFCDCRIFGGFPPFLRFV